MLTARAWFWEQKGPEPTCRLSVASLEVLEALGVDSRDFLLGGKGGAGGLTEPQLSAEVPVPGLSLKTAEGTYVLSPAPFLPHAASPNPGEGQLPLIILHFLIGSPVPRKVPHSVCSSVCRALRPSHSLLPEKPVYTLVVAPSTCSHLPSSLLQGHIWKSPGIYPPPPPLQCLLPPVSLVPGDSASPPPLTVPKWMCNFGLCVPSLCVLEFISSCMFPTAARRGWAC